MTTVYSKIDIFLKSPIYDVDIIPRQLKNTHRALLKIPHARYECDVDLTLKVFVKKLYTNIEVSYIFTLSKDLTYLKDRMPRGVLAREWRWELSGLQATSCTIYECGLMWVPHPVGGR